MPSFSLSKVILRFVDILYSFESLPKNVLTVLYSSVLSQDVMDGRYSIAIKYSQLSIFTFLSICTGPSNTCIHLFLRVTFPVYNRLIRILEIVSR